MNLLNLLTIPIKFILLLIIKFYQFVISPWFPPSCRYSPTCSSYAHEALKKHGIFKGGYLFLKRFLSCNPWGGHGIDPVPDKFFWYKDKKTCKKAKLNKNAN